MIAAHQTMMAPPALPYDAEVEYLESNGTQYVDTGVALSDASEVRFGIYAVQTSGRYGLFGSRSSAASNNVSGYINSNTLGLDFNNGNYNTYRLQKAIAVGDTAVAYSSATLREISVNGGTPSTSSDAWSGAFTTPSNCLICSINGSGWTLARIRIHSFQILESGVLVRDFIPVRVGSGSSAVGYLYDRASGTLFGNAGTGAFTIGPDKNGA